MKREKTTSTRSPSDLLGKTASKLAAGILCLAFGNAAFGAGALEPDSARLQEIYSQLGQYEPTETAFQLATPSETLLQKVYDYAVAAGYVDAKTHEFVGKGPRPHQFMPFDVAKASSVVYNESGSLVGYLDEHFNQFDTKGNYVIPVDQKHSGAKSAGTDSCDGSCTSDIIIAYQYNNFQGTRKTYNGKGSGYDVTDNYAFGSLVIGPGISITIRHTASPSSTTIRSDYYPASNQPRYLNGKTGYLKSFRVHANPYSGTQRSRRCGTLYTDSNYGGHALPFYDEQRFNLYDGYGGAIASNVWNDKVSSMIVANNTSCEHIGITNHGDGVSHFADRRLQVGVFVLGAIAVGVANLAAAEYAIPASDPNSTLVANDTASHVDTVGKPESCVDSPTDAPAPTTEETLGRMTQYMIRNGAWGAAWLCNTVEEICNPSSPILPNLGHLTATGTYFACSQRVGATPVFDMLLASHQFASGDIRGAAETLNSGTAAERKGMAKAVACAGAACLARAVAVGACNTYVRDWCQTQVNLAD